MFKQYQIVLKLIEFLTKWSKKVKDNKVMEKIINFYNKEFKVFGKTITGAQIVLAGLVLFIGFLLVAC